jgi:hypothetical protein
MSKGGVAMYVSNNITFKIREDLSVFHEGEFESIFIRAPAGCPIVITFSVRPSVRPSIRPSVRHTFG